MEFLGNVGVGYCFLYDNALFVVQSYDWEREGYYNICIASRNREKYDVGEEFSFIEETKVEIVPVAKLKDFIPKF